MKKKEIIEKTIKIVQHNAYTARILDELYTLGFDRDTMKYYRDIATGKAFGAMEVLLMLTGKGSVDIYENAIEEARQDITETYYDIIKLLNLAGYDGDYYYKTVSKRVYA